MCASAHAGRAAMRHANVIHMRKNPFRRPLAWTLAALPLLAGAATPAAADDLPPGLDSTLVPRYAVGLGTTTQALAIAEVGGTATRCEVDLQLKLHGLASVRYDYTIGLVSPEAQWPIEQGSFQGPNLVWPAPATIVADRPGRIIAIAEIRSSLPDDDATAWLEIEC